MTVWNCDSSKILQKYSKIGFQDMFCFVAENVQQDKLDEEGICLLENRFLFEEKKF